MDETPQSHKAPARNTLADEIAELDRCIEHLHYLKRLACECGFNALAQGLQADIDSAEAFKKYLGAPWALRN